MSWLHILFHYTPYQFKHASVLSCYYNRKNAVLIYTQIFFLFKLYIGIYVFRIGPLCMVYWSFFLHARNIDCILSKPTQLHYFFPHIFLCSVKIVLPPTRTLTVYTAITIGMTCVSDIRDTLAQIYNVNGRILRNVTWA